MYVWIRGVDLAHSIQNEVTIHKAKEYKYIAKEYNEKKINVLKSVEQIKGNFSRLMNQYLETTVFEEDKKLAYIVETDLSTNAQNGVEKLENLSKQIGSLSNNSKIIYVAIIMIFINESSIN